MLAALRHRGDQQAVAIQTPWHAGRCWRSNSPEHEGIASCLSGSIWVMLSGPLSNSQDVQFSLPENERPGPNAPDTDVVAALWKAHGTKMASLLKGHVSLALYDFRKGLLFLARDRFGLSNLYWSATPEAFIFSSEPRSLLAHPALQRRISAPAVRDYLVWGNIPAPGTIFEHVSKLEAGTWLTYQSGGHPTVGRYWEFPFGSRLESHHQPRQQSAEQFGELLCRSIEPLKNRPVGEVGTILSASLVSFLTTALAKQVLGLKGYKITGLLPWTQHRQRSHADSLQAMARKLGLMPTFQGIEHQTLIQALPTLVGRMAEPNADPQIAPFYCQMRMLEQQGFSVALLPEGLPLWGIDIPEWPLFRLLSLLDRTPKGFRRGLFHTVDVLSGGLQGGLRTRDLLAHYLDPDVPRPLRSLMGRTYAHSEWAQSLMSPGAIASTAPDPLALPLRLLKETPNQNPREAIASLIHRLTWYDSGAARLETVQSYSPLQMALPLADEDAVDYIIRTPWNYKHPHWWRSPVQDILIRRLLPGKLLPRRLPPPLELSADGFTGELKVWVEELTSERNMARFAFLDGERVRQLWKSHLLGETDARRGVWAMLVLLLWLNEHAA